jgi:hypothetical protein
VHATASLSRRQLAAIVTGPPTRARLGTLAVPAGVRPSGPIVRHVTERHGALMGNRSVLDELEGILTAADVIHRAPTEVPVDVRVPEVLDLGEPLAVEAVFPDGGVEPLEARLVDEAGEEVDRERLGRRGEGFGTVFDPVLPGAYQLHVRGYGSARARVTPVTATVLVWGNNQA